MKKTVLLGMAICFLISAALAGNKIELNVNKGDKFEMSSLISQIITQNAMGMEMKMDININMVMDLEVMEVNAGDVLFSQSYKSLKVDMSSPAQGLSIVMDSDGGASEMNAPLKSVIGKSILVRVDMQGKVISVEGLEEVMGDLQGAQATGADLLQFFNEESLDKNYQSLFPVEFGKDYNVGDSWTEEMNSDEGMVVESSIIYTATEVSKKKFEYSAVAEMSMEGTEENQGMEMEITMSGSFSGTGSVNPKTGLISSYSQSGKMTGKTVIEASEQMPMDMEIPMTIEMTVSTTVK